MVQRCFMQLSSEETLSGCVDISEAPLCVGMRFAFMD